MRVVRDVSAGGVIARLAEHDIEVVLVGREQPERWALPKGTPERGETLEDAALREVREETGLHVRILERLGDITYWFAVRGVRHHKTVYFYLLEATGGDIGDHDWEHDYVAWMPAEQALRRTSFANETMILERAIERVRLRSGANPAGTVRGAIPPPGA